MMICIIAETPAHELSWPRGTGCWQWMATKHPFRLSVQSWQAELNSPKYKCCIRHICQSSATPIRQSSARLTSRGNSSFRTSTHC